MNRPSRIVIAAMAAAVLCIPAFADSGLEKDIVVGRSISMPSKLFAPAVPLEISLPEGYEAGTARYPVVVAFQVTGRRFAAVAGLAAGLADAGIAPPLIVVSVGLDGDAFSLFAREGRPGSGRGPEVLSFLRDELYPWLEGRYRVAPYRILLGHSASALFCLHALFAAPDLADAVLSAGPMFAEVDFARVLDLIGKAAAARPASSQYLLFTQGDQPELFRDLAAFRDWLEKRRPGGLTWEFDPEPGENHGSLAMMTFYDGLRTLFADWATLPEAVALRGAPAIRAHKAALAARFRCDLALPPTADFRLKVKWTAERNFDALIALARFACEERPGDFYAHLSLGLAFEQAGRLGDAAASYGTAIETLKTMPEERAAPIRGRLEALRDAARKKAGTAR